MIRRRAALLPLVLLTFLPACGGAGGGTLALIDPAQLTQEMRDGCVALTLDLMQHVSDRAGQAVRFGRTEQLEELAATAGCGLIELDETTWVLVCEDVLLRGVIVTIRLDLTYTRDGAPVANPAASNALAVRVEVSGDVQASGLLTVADDFDLGLVFEGALSTTSFGGCLVDAEVQQATGIEVADLATVARGVVFTSGRVGLGVKTPEGRPLTGSAALVGRSAVVALEVDGVFSQGEIELGG